MWHFAITTILIMQAYLICVEPRVVLFGYATPNEMEKEFPVIKKARMLVKWSEATKGVLGAASHGPQQGSRISPAVTELHIRTKVECFIPCTDEAVKIWES